MIESPLIKTAHPVSISTIRMTSSCALLASDDLSHFKFNHACPTSSETNGYKVDPGQDHRLIQSSIFFPLRIIALLDPHFFFFAEVNCLTRLGLEQAEVLLLALSLIKLCT